MNLGLDEQEEICRLVQQPQQSRVEDVNGKKITRLQGRNGPHEGRASQRFAWCCRVANGPKTFPSNGQPLLWPAQHGPQVGDHLGDRGQVLR